MIPPTAAELAKRRSAIYALHRDTHRDHFSEDGNWVGPFDRDETAHSREWLWHSFAFLEGDAADRRLGDAIVAATPNTPNHFNSLGAAQVWIHYEDRLDDAAVEHLRTLINDGFAESIDFSFGANGVNNFTAMRAFFFLAAARLMEMYEVPYVHKSIPEVYNRFRVRKFGINLLRLLEAQLQRTRLAEEFNSPNYSPLTLMGIASVVCWEEDDDVRAIAERIERRLWEELLAFHHPRLGQQSGPFSRGYLADTVGHASNWRVISAFVGLDGATTVEDLLYRPVPGQVILPTLDHAHVQCMACWLMRPDFHIPADVLAAWSERTNPYSFEADYEWPGTGFRRSDGKVVLNVEGDYRTPGGRGTAWCYQEEGFALGSMSETHTAQNHACRVVYRHHEGDEPLGTCRAATLTYLVYPPPDFLTGPTGERAFPNLVPNDGKFLLAQDGRTVTGTVTPHHWFFYQPPPDEPGELSLNLMCSEHLPLDTPLESVRLNGEPFVDEPLEQEGDEGSFEIIDGAVAIRLRMGCAAVSRFRVERICGFVRCAAIPYAGSLPRLEPDQLAVYAMRFELSVEPRRDLSA